MRFYPLIRLSRTILFTDSLYSVNYQRFTSTCSQRWSINMSNNYSTSRYKCNHIVDNCLTTSSLVRQMSNPMFDLIFDLTSSRLCSLYLKWFQWIRSVNNSYQSSVAYFSEGDKKNDGNPFEGNPFNDRFDKLTKDLPPLLMDFVDPITTPGPFATIKNIFNLFLVIKPNYDSSFSLQTFLDGTRQAICVIADNLSRGETDSLEGLVEPEALRTIQENLVKFSPTQLADLKVDDSDIVFWLAKEIRAFERDDRKFVEITVIYHVIRGYQEKMTTQESRPFFMPDPEMTFCNYRFIREYTKGVDGDWICNRLNHFKWGHFIKNSPFAQ